MTLTKINGVSAIAQPDTRCHYLTLLDFSRALRSSLIYTLLKTNFEPAYYTNIIIKNAKYALIL